MPDQLTPPALVVGDPRDLTLLDVNARYMTHTQFARLVENVKRDGHLTSAPLVWLDPATGRRVVLSGNHRTRAAIAAELETIPWLEITGPLTRERRVSLQLSHNAITGQDDPAVLAELYQSLADLTEMQYAGLDDKTLNLLSQVDTSSLNEANLTYTSLQIMFLPHEYDAALAALEDAEHITTTDHRWVALLPQGTDTLEALTTVRVASAISNTATAFGVILEIFARHQDELIDNWYDPETHTSKPPTAKVPMETIFGTRNVPPGLAVTLHHVIRHIQKTQPALTAWEAIEKLAHLYQATEMAGGT